MQRITGCKAGGGDRGCFDNAQATRVGRILKLYENGHASHALLSVPIAETKAVRGCKCYVKLNL